MDKIVEVDLKKNLKSKIHPAKTIHLYLNKAGYIK